MMTAAIVPEESIPELRIQLPKRDDVSYKYRLGGKQATQYFEVYYPFEIRDALNETDQSND